jgi:hypothetical protein
MGCKNFDAISFNQNIFIRKLSMNAVNVSCNIIYDKAFGKICGFNITDSITAKDKLIKGKFLADNGSDDRRGSMAVREYKKFAHTGLRFRKGL